MNIIDVQEVTKRYANHLALDKISLSVKEGVVFGLLGPNGAGKTTLIRILNQITYPDSGVVMFKGKPLCEDDVRQIGYLPEERGLYKKMNAGEQAIYLAQLKGMDKNEAVKRLKIKFAQFEISNWWNRPVEELSKGMQQKLQFIITTLHKPSFLILDEPFSGFDPINANLLKDEILNLKKEGTTIILSTHNMASVEEICDEIVLINQAHKILEGNLFEVKNRFKKNIYLAEIEGFNENLTAQVQTHFELVKVAQQEHTTQYTVKIPEGSTSNDLLQLLMQNSSIIGFEEILPSMNEIFIEQVETFNQQSHHE